MSKQEKAPLAVDLDFAKVDLQRRERCGLPEVIFGQGKTPAQIVKIARVLQKNNEPVLATRLDPPARKALKQAFPKIRLHPEARMATLGKLPALKARVMVCAAGTSDLPVAEEAALTAEYFGNHVERIYDVGVAGLHRLLDQIERIRAADVILAVAGMEGTLPSVIGGLVDKPVIAVPTSIGYGANMQGLTALCAMLTGCASGVTVVNIDNGFGAAYAATQITRMLDK
ncbi:MAG: nickel pincer cofactor biosynthesis protein LarB [Verrucomicrobiota bacterium]